jgi:hypothetical protein
MSIRSFPPEKLDRAALLQRVGHMDQVAGVRMLEAADGSARGSRMLQMWTGTGLTLNILPDRALDISAASFRGAALGWTSSVGDAHPAYFEPEGLGWLRTFPGGLLATCGLDQFGSPNQDSGEALGQHGRVGAVPARYVSCNAHWQGDDYVLEVSGEVRQTRMFGENLVLRRRISSALYSNTIRIEDTITNEAYTPAPHMILYHFNIGYPMLSEHTRLVFDAKQTTPRDAEAIAGVEHWSTFETPTPGYREQVFMHTPNADDSGLAKVELHNPHLGLGLRWRFPVENLPGFLQWKQMGQSIYVLGIEPANCFGVLGRARAREDGILPILQPGESRHYEISLEVFEVA